MPKANILPPEFIALHSTVKSIGDFKIENLVNPKAASGISFDGIRLEIESAINFYSEATGHKFESLPLPVVQELNKAAARLNSFFNEIQNLDLSGNPTQRRDDLAQNFRIAWGSAYQMSAPHFAWLKAASISSNDNEKSLQERLGAFSADSKKVLSEAAEKTKELDKALHAARDLAASRATLAQAQVFDSEAKENCGSAKKWLSASFVVVVVALIVTYCLFIAQLSPNPQATQPRSNLFTNSVAQPALPASGTQLEKISLHDLQSLVARVVIVTLLYLAVLLCMRNYSACRHNFTVNRHRRNAMQTFQAFRQAGHDPETQDFVLKQAVACAFAPQQTGYLKTESLPEQPPMLIDPARVVGSKPSE